jgi:hypothetical protein
LVLREQLKTVLDDTKFVFKKILKVCYVMVHLFIHTIKNYGREKRYNNSNDKFVI